VEGTKMFLIGVKCDR